MGLDDFDAGEPEEAADLDAWQPGDEDSDLFSFPELELEDAIKTVESLVLESEDSEPEIGETLADTLDAIDELGDELGNESLLADLDDTLQDESAAPLTPDSAITAASNFDLDEDLFDFEELEIAPAPVSNDYVQDIDSVFTDEDLELAEVNPDALDELLQSLDEAPPTAQLDAPKQAPEPAVAQQATTSEPRPVAEPLSTPAAEDPTPVAPASVATAPAQTAARSAQPARSSGLPGRLAKLPLGWLAASLLLLNTLALVIFWSSLSGMRSALIETVHKVASAAPAQAINLAPAVTRQPIEVVQHSQPTWDAGQLDSVPPDRKIPHERYLEAGEWNINERRYAEARSELYQLLAQIDAVDFEVRAEAEARANFLIAESLRIQARELESTEEQP